MPKADMNEGQMPGCERVALVIAAYNEAVIIRSVVTDARKVFPWVVVVDDGSDDDTAIEAGVAGATVLVHPINLGQGAALQTGIDYAVLNDASHVVTFDADGQHLASDVVNMLQLMYKHDAQVVLGSRFLGSAEAMSNARRLLLKAATAFTRITSGLQVTDAHNGLRVLRRDAAQTIRLRQNRMAHASEILNEIGRRKLRYVEAPVTIRYTEYSKTKGQSGWGSVNILFDLFLARLRK